MVEYIDRQEVIETVAFYREDPDGVDHALNSIKSIPSADVQPVVRCKDCVYRPYYEPSDSKSASDLVFPDYRFNLCPCRVEDFWYSWMPDDDWFCAYGKRMNGEGNG